MLLPKFSVKKPMTIIVAVVIIIVLGVISFTNMQTDLLPSIDLPYVAVMTTYPGASPEKVESAVTDPLEEGLSTISGIADVTSVSSENQSVVLLAFEQDVNMDSAMLDISNMLDILKPQLEDGVSEPIPMKMNPDMLPVVVSAVHIDGESAKEATPFIEEQVIPTLERVEGVASVNAAGLVEDTVQVHLNQQKIDDLNQKLALAINEKFAAFDQELDKAQQQLSLAQQQLTQQTAAAQQNLVGAQTALSVMQQELSTGSQAVDSIVNAIESTATYLEQQKAALEEELSGKPENSLTYQAQRKELDSISSLLAAVEEMKSHLSAQKGKMDSTLEQIEQQKENILAGNVSLAQAQTEAQMQLMQAQLEIQQNRNNLEESEQKAKENTDLNAIITQEMIANILQADNFSMPAGYLSSGDQRFSVKVGEGFSSLDEIQNLGLIFTQIDGIGTIRLSDVADVSIQDNASDSYAKINGEDGILLTIQKQSGFSTTEVSKNLNKAFASLSKENSSLQVTTLDDQGIYIHIILRSVIENLIMGGVLSIIILLLFLRTIRPTIVIACSIPISLMFAIVLMYFSGITLNVISLAGLALGVGMLVDNSIVVIENIYRWKSQGFSSSEAAVKGARQVAGAVLASTITTICVFLPIVFTDGISKELFADMGLTIAYSLLASLFVSLTLVPAMASTTLRNASEKTHSLFKRFQGLYGSILDKTLNHKLVVLLLALFLFITSIFGAFSMGSAFFPTMDSDQIIMQMEMPKGSTEQETRQMSDQIIDIVTTIPSVETIGSIQSGSIDGSSANDTTVDSYLLLSPDREDTSSQIVDEIKAKTADLDCELTVSDSTMSSSSLGGSGIQVVIQGDNLDTLQSMAGDVASILSEIEGVVDVSDGMEQSSTQVRLEVNKDKAMENGLTVAQVYQEVVSLLNHEESATTVQFDTGEYPVIVLSGNEITMDNLLAQSIPGTKDGSPVEVALGDIVTLSTADSPSSIEHQGRERTMVVSAQVDSEHNIGLATRQLREQLDAYATPSGYSIELAGESETIQETFMELIKMGALALLLIYLIMVAEFQSLLSPFIVMFTIPLAFTGGLLLLWLCGFDLTVIALLGFIMLSGIVVNNGIVFVDYVNQLIEQGVDKRKALVQAGMTRMRPILMTALTTTLGLLTLAFGFGQGAELLQPMAVVTIGGLSYATILTLFVVPALYELFHTRFFKRSSLR